MDNINEAKRLVEEGWRPYWNKKRNLIVFKKGNNTRSLGITYDPKLYQELLNQYNLSRKKSEYEEIEKAIKETRTSSRPIEKERIDRLAEHEMLITQIGRAALEIYNDVSVDPEELVGKSPEERAKIKAEAIIEKMKKEHEFFKPKPEQIIVKAETDKIKELTSPLANDYEKIMERLYRIAYVRLFEDVISRVLLPNNIELYCKAIEEWNKLVNDEKYVHELYEYAKRESGLDIYLNFDTKGSIGKLIEMLARAKAEYETSIAKINI
jgi:hypothetical protein